MNRLIKSPFFPLELPLTSTSEPDVHSIQWTINYEKKIRRSKDHQCLECYKPEIQNLKRPLLPGCSKSQNVEFPLRPPEYKHEFQKRDSRK